MHKKIAPRSAGVVMLIAAAVLWSTSGYFIKLVDWHPLAIAGMRSAIALVPIFILYGKPKKLSGCAEIGAAVCYSLTLLSFVSANKMTTAANAILLQYSMPVYVIILSAPLLKEKIYPKDVATVFVVFFGLVLFFFDKLDATGALGNVIALVSGVTLALMVIFLRMQKDKAPINSVLWGNIFTAAAGLPFYFTNGTPGAVSWAGLVFLGVFQLGFAYILYAKALKHVSTVETALYPMIEPLLNPMLVAVLTGEVPGVFPLVGGAVVLAGVAANILVRKK